MNGMGTSLSGKSSHLIPRRQQPAASPWWRLKPDWLGLPPGLQPPGLSAATHPGCVNT